MGRIERTLFTLDWINDEQLHNSKIGWIDRDLVRRDFFEPMHKALGRKITIGASFPLQRNQTEGQFPPNNVSL